MAFRRFTEVCLMIRSEVGVARRFAQVAAAECVRDIIPPAVAACLFGLFGFCVIA